MGKNFTTAFALCLAISALPLACGDDEDDDGGSSKGGSSGDAGSSTGGRAGSSTGGRAGSSTGGSPTGGRAGSGGSGVTGGTAGSATGGMGGAEGGMGGDDGGMGGEGGTPEPPMSLCEQVCDGPAGTCMADCVTTFCEVFYTNAAGTPACEPLLDAMMTCWAAGDDANWMCAQGSPTYSGTECQDEVYAAYNAGCI